MTIRFLMLGKTRRPEMRALFEDYAARIARYAKVELTEWRPAGSSARRKPLAEPGAVIVLLDAAGRQFTSPEFARWVAGLRDRGARELVFLCGGAEGFPPEIRALAKQAISLSPMTLPHELARVVLAEQIYRAFAILAGHPYPR